MSGTGGCWRTFKIIMLLLTTVVAFGIAAATWGALPTDSVARWV
jgi:hypothetical protein